MRSAILSGVRAGCCPSCDWLQRSRAPHKIGPVLSFPHASAAAVPQPSNALWRGFELAHGPNSTQKRSCPFAVAWRAALAVAYVCRCPKSVGQAAY